MSESETLTTGVRTARGMLVRVGQLYRDRRDDNIRTLRVDGFRGTGTNATAVCTVIRQEYLGEVTKPMRTTEPSITRLTSRAFVLVVDDRAHIAGVIAQHIAHTITAADDLDECLIDCACGAEIVGKLDGDPESQVGAIQRLMAAHIAEAVAEAIGQEASADE
ncbi:hypothetical protein AB0L97_32840 [Nocardia sp. NPDC051911]|uniref:hypothetical protein n=1 Tax=Nocardia sp. NPDC051911 TaxID=3154648 RepID=UPI00342DD5A7